MFPKNIIKAIAPMNSGKSAPRYSVFVITIMEHTAYTIAADTMRYTGVFFVPSLSASKSPRTKKKISAATVGNDWLAENHSEATRVILFIIKTSI